jgi:WD40 repeat protein
LCAGICTRPFVENIRSQIHTTQDDETEPSLLTSIPYTTNSIPFSLSCSSRSNGTFVNVCDESGYCTYLHMKCSTKQAEPIYSFESTSRFHAHGNAIFDIQFISSLHDSQFITGSGDQTVAIWDVETKNRLGNCKGHIGSVKTVRIRGDSAGNKSKQK